ncbi:VCBS repeat-containing protein [Streptomyces sp. NPDC050738]|uniref:FG-GAP repeat domain-containing protein n=1 Tax=Streptomyces sp. NPDC050738 TaxID=3154744 RepID=UPI00343198AB
MKRKRSLRRARHIAVAGTAGVALLAALVGSGGTAAADTAPADRHVSTPGWKAVLSGGSGANSLLSVTSADAQHAWAAGLGADGHGVLMGWDGQTWAPVKDPALPQVERWSAVSAASADDVWAYGSTTTSTGGTQSLVHYDGKQWTTVPAAGALDRDWPEVPVKAVPGRLFKGGDALYTYSDGAWQTFALPQGVDIHGIDAVSADDAYATGMQYPVEGGHPVAYHWDGTTWTLMPQPPAPAVVEMSEVAAVSPDDVYMAGWGYPPGAEPPLTHVEHWDGSAWHDVSGDLSGFIVESIRPDGHGGLWAAGSDAASVNAEPVFWHYDGTTWTKQSGATVSGNKFPSYSFHDIAPVDSSGGSRFLAVGDYAAPTNSPSDPQTSLGLIEQTQNSLDLTTTDLPLSSTTKHTVRVHAEGSGRLTVGLRPADGQPDWSKSVVDIKVASVSGAPQGACDHAAGPVNGAVEAVSCDLPAGDHTVTYALAVGASVSAWQITADVRFQASDAGATSPAATAGFAVDSPYPVQARSRFLARDAQGTMWRYDGTGDATAPYAARVAVSNGWQGFTAITALSNLTVRGTGDLVARDASGVLWYYRGGGDTLPFTPRVKVGSGWNAYNSLTGAGDLTGDGRADLLARDTSGVQWLYEGTTSTTAPFAPRVKIGSGWNAYNSLTGAGDLTGDGRADLLARDASGVLWLYAGTGKAAAPYAARAQVGTGWTIYNTLLVPGDLTGDGRADILGRDASGVLWLYPGTGKAATPYGTRIKVGTGWNIYNSLL